MSPPSLPRCLRDGAVGGGLALAKERRGVRREPHPRAVRATQREEHVREGRARREGPPRGALRRGQHRPIFAKGLHRVGRGHVRGDRGELFLRDPHDARRGVVVEQHRAVAQAQDQPVGGGVDHGAIARLVLPLGRGLGELSRDIAAEGHRAHPLTVALPDREPLAVHDDVASVFVAQAHAKAMRRVERARGVVTRQRPGLQKLHDGLSQRLVWFEAEHRRGGAQPRHETSRGLGHEHRLGEVGDDGLEVTTGREPRRRRVRGGGRIAQGKEYKPDFCPGVSAGRWSRR